MTEPTVNGAMPTDTIDARRARVVGSPSVLGYADLRSVRTGGHVTFYVSSEAGQDYDAQLFRLTSPEIGPLGPPFKAERIDAPVNGRHSGTHQPIRAGSCARIAGPLPVQSALTFDVIVQPTLVEATASTIAMFSSADGFTLTLDHSTAGLRAVARRERHTVAAVTLPPLRLRAWTGVSVSIDLAAGRLSLRADPHRTAGFVDRDEQVTTSTWAPDPGDALIGLSLTLAASIDGDGHHDPATCFNGKLECPRLFDGDDDSEPSAHWDFAEGIPTEMVLDIGPNQCHGVLHNLPTRGTRGSTWTGAGLSWVADPASYAAIHFHDDDLADAGWSPSFTYEVPVDLPSACYAMRLQPADDSTPEFWVPFVVRPEIGAPTRSIAYVIPTTTYGAYANMHLRVTAQFNELAHGRLTVLDSTDFLLLTMPELGKSTYDTHRDGSPVIYSSMNRPVTNFRPTGRMYKFCLDLMITDWLDGLGFDVDVITDDDLHVEGVAALAPYRVAITGSHPEYLTRAELDAFEEFTRSGGRLMYLGGNGFYSAAEIPTHRLDVVEVRRPGQDALWRVNHAEGTFSTSGLPGGLWRNIGRPENAVIGVGFITQGFDACTGYTRSAASHDDRVSWIFDGVGPDERIGEFGILQGGAAGYEIDRHEITKGSPSHSVVLASSSGHSNLYDLMVPSILDTLPDPARTQDPIRADMVFFETDGGGAVFSVGSIAWSGSLSHNAYDNSVSRVTANVLRRFADPQPFVPPCDA
jgi:N,N-dimethylformamidase